MSKEDDDYLALIRAETTDVLRMAQHVAETCEADWAAMAMVLAAMLRVVLRQERHQPLGSDAETVVALRAVVQDHPARDEMSKWAATLLLGSDIGQTVFSE
jgi:hypothetical protein